MSDINNSLTFVPSQLVFVILRCLYISVVRQTDGHIYLASRFYGRSSGSSEPQQVYAVHAVNEPVPQKFLTLMEIVFA